jgi:hypothetical protein
MDAESVSGAYDGARLAVCLKRGDQIARSLDVLRGEFANCTLVERGEFVRRVVVQQETGKLRVGITGDVSWPKELIA